MPENVPYAREVLNAFPTTPTPATDYYVRVDGRIQHYISDLAAPYTLRPVTFNAGESGVGTPPPTDVTRTGALTSTQTYGSLASVRQRFRPTVNIPVTGVQVDQITVSGNAAVAFHDLTTGQWVAAAAASQVGAGITATLSVLLLAGHEYFLHVGTLGSGINGTDYPGFVSGVTLSSGHAWTGLTLTAPPTVFESATPVTAGAQLAFQLLTGDMTGYDPSGVTIKGISPVTVDYDGTKREYTVSLGGESGAVAAFGWGTPNSETLGTASGSSPHVFNYTFDEPATLTKVEIVGTTLSANEMLPVGTLVTFTASGESRTVAVTAQAGVFNRLATLDPPLAMPDGTVAISVPTNAYVFSAAATVGAGSPDGGVTYDGSKTHGLFCILHTGVLNGMPDNIFPITAIQELPDALSSLGSRVTALEGRPVVDAEFIQDTVGAMLPQGTYDDTAGTVSFTFAQARTDEEIQDVVAALIQAGTNVTKVYDDAGNVLTISATGSGSGTALARSTVNVTTGTLADGTYADVLLPLGRTYLLYQLTATTPCWARGYLTPDDRTADGSRGQAQDPTPGAGVVFELIGTSARWSQAVAGWDAQSTPNGQVAVRVTNLSGATTALTLTATFLTLEA